MSKRMRKNLFILFGLAIFFGLASWAWKGTQHFRSVEASSSVSTNSSDEIDAEKKPSVAKNSAGAIVLHRSLKYLTEQDDEEAHLNEDDPTVNDLHTHIIRSQVVQLEPSLKVIGAAYQRGEISQFDYPLFGVDRVTIDIRDYRSIKDNSGVLTGRVAGQDLSHVSIAYVEGAEAGTIQMPESNEFYEIRNGPEPGSIILTEIDVSALKGCSLCNPKESTE